MPDRQDGRMRVEKMLAPVRSTMPMTNDTPLKTEVCAAKG
jgi:hypothetical protein